MRHALVLFSLLAFVPTTAAAPVEGCHVVVCAGESVYEGDCDEDLGFEAGSTAVWIPVAGFQIVLQGYSYCYRFGDSYGSAENVNAGVYGVLFVGAGVGTYSYSDADGTEEGTIVSAQTTYVGVDHRVPIAPVRPNPGWGSLLP